jgi:PAS domain S-box-containing protein
MADDMILRNLVETSVGGMMLIDARGCILVFNEACERLFGYRQDEVLGQSVEMLKLAPGHNGHDAPPEGDRHNGEAPLVGIRLEEIGRRKDGSTFPFALSVSEAKDGGEPVFVGIVHDLRDVQRPRSMSMIADTRRRRIEAEAMQSERLRAVGQLSGGIAHDFNNLLTVIIGNADMLAERLKARHELKHMAEHIVAAGERGAELTQRLLSFGRKQMLRPMPIDCNKLVESMHEMLRRTLSEDIEIQTKLDPELALAIADQGQLESAILNLSLNARDAMPKGGCLTIATAHLVLHGLDRSHHPDVPPGDYVMIAVTDDGEGMPAAVRARAFEPFFTTKDVGKGSGLGLSMVYGFANQSNGHLALYSEPGLGTTVRLYLPATSDTPAADAISTGNTAIPKGQGTILVVEDDAFVRAYGVACLQSLGYRVIAAIDGDEGLAALAERGPIDLLFTDVIMPGSMNGMELVERAKQVQPGIKALLTSGYARETLVARGRLDPSIDVLYKPYRMVELARRVHEIMDR